jgi:hypothetical protein
LSEPAATPDVSVVIPTRDRWSLLATAVTSALSQDGVRLELVVIDDGSVDDAPTHLTACNDRRLAILRKESSGGVAQARNLGIKAARGKWIAFLDDDDVWAPGKLRRQLDVAETAGADFAYSSAVVIDSHYVPIRKVPATSPGNLRASLAVAPEALPAGQSNVIVRAAFVRELGGFNEELAVLADWDMWIRMAWSGRAAALHEIHVGYRLHPGMMSSTVIDCSEEIDRMLRFHGPIRMDARSAATFPARWKANALRSRGQKLLAAREYLASAKRTRRLSLALRAGSLLRGERARSVFDTGQELEWLGRYRGSARLGEERATGD